MPDNKRFLVLLVATVLALAIPQTGCGAAGDSIAPWTGGHTRLVWLQDHGNGADSLANGKNLMLYGYDSKDGRGERPLLAKMDNYFRPMFTPDGRQVVFSNRLTRQMYLLDWDSGKVQELGSGVAVEVWEDPRPSLLLRRKTIWIYCYFGLQPENRYGTSQPLYRFPLDNPKKKELLWDKTNLAWDNLQLSRDGEVLGGLFPWPAGGVLWTKDKRWQRLGKGCWTSLSPDNSKLLWIFDGLHRNVQIYDVVAGTNWKVNINSAPGIGGFEVYHPRWSNHPRYFVLTGPYEKGEGGNRIGGGGEKVEIYIGRFDERAQHVEDWLKVTDNNRADFYPELWIEGGNTAQLSDQMPQAASVVQAESWPAVRDRLVFVWEDMKAANQLEETSPVGFFQCNIELRGRALFTRNLQLATGGGFGETGEAGKKIAAALARTGQVSIELVVTPETDGKGSVLAFAGGGKAQLQLYQEGDSLQVHSAAAAAQASWPGMLVAGKPVHLAVNLDGKNLEVFFNGRSGGKKELQVDLAGGAFDSLTIGDTSGSLQARISGVAVYDRMLEPAAIIANSSLAAARTAREVPSSGIILRGKLLETTEIPAPDAIGAYRRALVVNIYTVDEVVRGQYGQDRVLVAEWAILDREIIKSYVQPAQPEELVLEKFSEHPQLEGERQMMDVFEPELDMYYRLPASAGR